jgi:hypothetical protein
VEDVLIGLLAILVGGVFCFRGYLSMRIVFPLWGAWIGFVFGATLVASFADEGFLSSLLGWLVGLVFAVVFALLAYLFYEVAVIIGMATIGYVLGVAVLVALDVEWSWLVTLVGIACGALLAIAAVKLELPVVLLIVLTAAAGATAMVGGVMLLVGAIDIDDLSRSGVTNEVDASVWWWALDLGLAVAGIVSQGRAVDRLRVSMREAWETGGGGRAAA